MSWFCECWDVWDCCMSDGNCQSCPHLIDDGADDEDELFLPP